MSLTTLTVRQQLGFVLRDMVLFKIYIKNQENGAYLWIFRNNFKSGFFHDDNKRSFIPLAHAVEMKETHESI